MDNIVVSLTTAILAATAQGVSMPLWIDRIYGCSDPYVVFLITTIWYPTMFFISAVVHNWWTKSPVGIFRYGKKQLWDISWVGCFDALNGVFVVVASPPERTPPVISALLGGGLVMLLMVPIKHMYMKYHKAPGYDTWSMYKHNSFYSFVLFTLLAVYLLMYVPIHNNTPLNTELYWWGLFLLGLVFGSFYNVQQELFFKQHRHSTLNHFLNYMFWQTLCLCFWGHFVTWFDLIPGFGNGTASNLGCNFRDTYYYSFSGQGLAFSFVFNFGYYISYIASCYINRRDALIGTIASVVTTALVIIITYPINELTPDRSVVEIGLLPITFLMGALATYYYASWSQQISVPLSRTNTITGSFGVGSGDSSVPQLIQPLTQNENVSGTNYVLLNNPVASSTEAAVTMDYNQTQVV